VYFQCYFDSAYAQNNQSKTLLFLELHLLATCFHAGIFLGLFFDPAGGDNMFLRNVDWLSTNYAALDPAGGDNMFLRKVDWLSTNYAALYPSRWYPSGSILVARKYSRNKLF
jgi:hypothetical protein